MDYDAIVSLQVVDVPIIDAMGKNSRRATEYKDANELPLVTLMQGG